MAREAEREVISVGGREVAISNPDKVLFPGPGHTKLDLVRYYLAVASGALRAAGGRPNVLVRYPNGIGGEFFYQKRAPRRGPAWIEVVALRFPSGRTAEEVVPRDAGGARVDGEPRRASSCTRIRCAPTISTTPTSCASISIRCPACRGTQMREVARVVRATLDDFGLVGWPKTSGSRGIHVYVRIEPRWTFTQVRRAALALAREVERRAPALATSKWWKEERHGVFLDYNQNAKDRTVAGAYSVRPTPDARVSAPLTWDELDACEPADFTLATMPARFAAVGDPHAGIDDAPVLARRAARAVGAAGARGPRRRAVAAALREAGRRAAARRSRRSAGRAGTPQPLIEIGRARDRRRRRSPASSAGRRAIRTPPRTSSRPTCSSIACAAASPPGRASASTWSTCPQALRPRAGAARSRRRRPNDWGATSAGRAAPAAEDLRELVRRRDLELIVAAVARAACRGASAGRPPRGGSGRPACGRTSPRTRARRAAAPTTGPCRRSSGSARRACACEPSPGRRPRRATGGRRARPSRSGASSAASCFADRHRERRRHADVVQRAVVVVEAEQQRADQLAGAVLVPAEAGDDAVGGAHVLDLQHRALARLVRAARRLGDHAVEPGALEAVEPVGGERRDRACIGVRCTGGAAPASSALEQRAALAPAAARAGRGRPRRAGRTPRTTPASPRASFATRDAAGCRRICSASKSRPPARGDHDLAVDHAAARAALRASSVVQLGKVAVERLADRGSGCRRRRRRGRRARGSRPTSARRGSRRPRGCASATLREHRLDRRRDRKRRLGGRRCSVVVGHRAWP